MYGVAMGRGRNCKLAQQASVALFVALCVALLLYAASTGTPMRIVDEQQYFDIARNLADGNGYLLRGKPSAYRPPVWPIILAAFLAIGLPAKYLAVVSALCMIGAAILAWNIVRTLTSNHTGIIAAFAVLLYPLNVYTASTLYPQALGTFLVLWLWATVLTARKKFIQGSNSIFEYLLIGIIAALLTLSIPTLAFTGVAAIAWLCVTFPGHRLTAGAWSLAGLLVPLTAWTARNFVTMSSPIPISTSSGKNLLIGNNASATGTSGVAVDIEKYLSAAREMNEVQRDKFYRDSAIDWVFNNPGHALHLYLAKLASYFSPYNEPVTGGSGSELQRFIAYASFAIVILLVLIRFLVLRSRLSVDPTEWFFLAIFLSNSVVMAVFFTRARFRQPLDSILLVEAGISLAVAVVLAAGARSKAAHSVDSFRTV